VWWWTGRRRGRECEDLGELRRRIYGIVINSVADNAIATLVPVDCEVDVVMTPTVIYEDAWLVGSRTRTVERDDRQTTS